jgi:hypothetical protein
MNSTREQERGLSEKREEEGKVGNNELMKGMEWSWRTEENGLCVMM